MDNKKILLTGLGVVALGAGIFGAYTLLNKNMDPKEASVKYLEATKEIYKKDIDGNTKVNLSVKNIKNNDSFELKLNSKEKYNFNTKKDTDRKMSIDGDVSFSVSSDDFNLKDGKIGLSTFMTNQKIYFKISLKDLVKKLKADKNINPFVVSIFEMASFTYGDKYIMLDLSKLYKMVMENTQTAEEKEKMEKEFAILKDGIFSDKTNEDVYKLLDVLIKAQKENKGIFDFRNVSKRKINLSCNEYSVGLNFNNIVSLVDQNFDEIINYLEKGNTDRKLSEEKKKEFREEFDEFKKNSLTFALKNKSLLDEIKKSYDLRVCLDGDNIRSEYFEIKDLKGETLRNLILLISKKFDEEYYNTLLNDKGLKDLVDYLINLKIQSDYNYRKVELKEPEADLDVIDMLGNFMMGVMNGGLIEPETTIGIPEESIDLENAN